MFFSVLFPHFLCVFGLLWLGPFTGSDQQDLSGPWYSDAGVWNLEQRGSFVIGNYTHGEQKGSLGGQTVGLLLQFRFRQSETNGEGRFEIAPDGQVLRGVWHPEQGEPVSLEFRRQKPEEPSTFDGLWGTNYGRVRLVESDGVVQGIYESADRSILEGQLDDRTLKFDYRESTDHGQGEFTLSEDGTTFTGRWKGHEATGWTRWNGTRLSPQQHRRWLVILEARWEGSLREREYSFGEMLRTFFARTRSLQIRHRIFNDLEDFQAWSRELAFLAEPAYLVISTHATTEGLVIGDRVIDAASIAESLKWIPTLELIHFSSCEMLKAPMEGALRQAFSHRPQTPISGYTTSVDWAQSAIIDFLYLDLILDQRYSPVQAAEIVLKELPFAASEPQPHSLYAPAGFRLLSR